MHESYFLHELINVKLNYVFLLVGKPEWLVSGTDRKPNQMEWLFISIWTFLAPTGGGCTAGRNISYMQCKHKCYIYIYIFLHTVYEYPHSLNIFFKNKNYLIILRVGNSIFPFLIFRPWSNRSRRSFEHKKRSIR